LENESNLSSLDKTILYTIRIPALLQKKIDSHLQILKVLKHPEKNQHKWLLNAIHKKLLKEVNSQEISKSTNLNVKLDDDLADQVDKRISQINRVYPSYSKKQWLLEAIEEKLESENDMVQNKLAQFRK